MSTIFPRIPLDHGYYVQIFVNRCSGEPYVKWSNGRVGEDEETFYFGRDTYESVLNEMDGITEAWDTPSSNKRRPFTYGDGVMMTLVKARVNGSLPSLQFSKYVTTWNHEEYDDFFITRPVWDSFCRKTDLIAESIEKVGEDWKKVAAKLAVNLDGKTLVQMEAKIPVVMFHRIANSRTPAWSYSMPFAAFVALKKWENEITTAVEEKKEYKGMLAERHGIHVQEFKELMYLCMSKFNEDGDRVRGCGMNLSPHAFKALMANFDNLMESYHLSMEQVTFWNDPKIEHGSVEEDEILFEGVEKAAETFYSEGDEMKPHMRRALDKLSERMQLKGSFDMAICELLELTYGKEDGENASIEVEASDSGMETEVDKEEADGGEEGLPLEMVTDEPEKEAFPTPPSSPKSAPVTSTPNRTPVNTLKRASSECKVPTFEVKETSEISDVPSAPKKLKLTLARRPRIPLYSWKWVSVLDDEILEKSYKFFMTEEACHKHEKEARQKAGPTIAKPFNLVIETNEMDKPTPHMVVSEVLLCALAGRVMEVRRKFCEGCHNDLGNQEGHLRGCLMPWMESVQMHFHRCVLSVLSEKNKAWICRVLEALEYDTSKVDSRMTAAFKSKTEHEWEMLVLHYKDTRALTRFVLDLAVE